MRRFITDASHELRTPLTTMRGFAELYRQGAARDMEMVMSRIESESRRMGLLIDDLLLLARLDTQRPIERNGSICWRWPPTPCTTHARSRPNARSPLRWLTVPARQRRWATSARLRQVLGNLMTNALQHTPETADITVRVGTTSENAILEVVDKGPGMSQEDALRVFERFYRTDSSRTRSSGGTGLGLSIVDSLVYAHGGTVNVDNDTRTRAAASTSACHGSPTFPPRSPLDDVGTRRRPRSIQDPQIKEADSFQPS